MAIGSGLSGQLGVGKETTYGTFVAPSKFFEFDKASVELELIRVDGGGIAAGRAARLVSQSIVAGRSGSASGELSVPTVGFGLILQQLMGTSVTPVQQATTTAYLQTHALNADLGGKMLTIQVGVPQTTGTVTPYSGLGGKITKAGFKCSTDEALKCSLDFDLRDVTDASALATASYPAAVMPFNFTQMSVKAGATVAGATALTGITGFSLDIERKQKTDARYAGSGGLKAEPITNDYVGLSGSVDADFLVKADLMDRFTNNTTTSLVWDFTGSIIASTYAYQFTVELPAVKFTKPGHTTVDGPDVVSGGFPFTVYSDGSNPIATIKYMSTDVTL
jgi:hypothetical protein